MKDIPNAFDWFVKLKLLRFIPWHIKDNLEHFSSFNVQFKKEYPEKEVATFANRQDMDTFAGFEIVEGKITERIITFHLTFGSYNSNRNIIEAEYEDFFEFMEKDVLPTMKEWIQDDDVEDYIISPSD